MRGKTIRSGRAAKGCHGSALRSNRLHAASGRGRRFFRPALEQLEDRRLLANVPPSFTPGADVGVGEDSPAFSASWATGISVGPPEESGQTAAFLVENDNAALFAVPPALAPDGTLSFTPAANAHGMATVTVALMDDGGTDAGGDDTSDPVVFAINVSPVNDAPGFTPGANFVINEDAGPFSAPWATNISVGPPDETGQTATFQVSSNFPTLFIASPSIAADGTLSFAIAPNRHGRATITVVLADDGGTTAGGDNTSEPVTFTLTVRDVEVLISEFVADNVSSLLDEDQDASDWIELRNRGVDSVDLSGWFLTGSAATLDAWAIPPGTVLDPNEFLIVFASGKDRTAPLHTNFTLANPAGYVALVQPDRTTIASQFNYVDQLPDRSRGFREALVNKVLIDASSAVRVRVPSTDVLGSTWTGAQAFDDSLAAGWTQGTGAVGFEAPPAAVTFSVNTRSTVLNTVIRSIVEADAVLAGQRVSQSLLSNHATVNFIDTPAGVHGSHFGGDTLFGVSGDNFVIRATGTAWVPADQGGPWTFGLTSDDGFRLRIDGVEVLRSDFFTFGDLLTTVELSPGPHAIELTYFEFAQVAEVELYAAKGKHSEFNSSFQLVGATAPGALALGGFAQRLNTNIRTSMWNINSTAYLRYPFSLFNVVPLDSLALEVEYNDGFVAYLNGELVASVNAPATLTHQSAATAAAPFAKTLLNLTPFLDELKVGENILAVQALSAGINDGRFIFSPRLTARERGAPVAASFLVPTAGSMNGARDPVISEVSAANATTLNDEDGDSRDWIEIHNPGTTDINLAGWHLT
ncbi:MAG: lamin tail domain-containing protein, partial [Pirellulales bacterium]